MHIPLNLFLKPYNSIDFSEGIIIFSEEEIY